jgi:quercetin dioxygenase-like cupin family protein
MGRGMADSSLKYHLSTAKKNGVTRDEIAAIITHAAFYAGWPIAWAVFNMAKEVWADDEPALTDKDRFQKQLMFPIGEPNDAYARYFVGQSYLAPVSTEQVPISNVTFEPGCRNNWHIHHAKRGGGQMLVCVGGRGWYQERGRDAVELVPGTVVNIPANVEHWHGASADSWMAHLAIPVAGEDASNEWLEPVSDEEYAKLAWGASADAEMRICNVADPAPSSPGIAAPGGIRFHTTPRHREPCPYQTGRAHPIRGIPIRIRKPDRTP